MACHDFEMYANCSFLLHYERPVTLLHTLTSRILFCGRSFATTGRTQSNAHFHGVKVSC